MDNKIELPSLFISYAWGDGNDCADELCNQLKNEFRIVRDKLGLSVKEELTKFMKRIDTTDYAIIVLTNKYLKSINCMYEATYLTAQCDWINRTLVLIVNGDIYDVNKKIEVLRYWQERHDSLQDYKIDETYINGLELDGKKLDMISENIGEFLKVITDSKNPSQIAIVQETINMKKSNSISDAEKINESNEKRILEYLQKNSSASRDEIAGYLGVTKAYSTRLIQRLKEKKRIVQNSNGRKITFSTTEM